MRFGEMQSVELSDMFLTPLGEWVATAWWVIPVVLGLLILNLVTAKPRRRRRRGPR